MIVSQHVLLVANTSMCNHQQVVECARYACWTACFGKSSWFTIKVPPSPLHPSPPLLFKPLFLIQYFHFSQMKDALAKLLKHKRLHGQRPENGTNVRNIVLELGSLLLRRGRHYPVLSEYLSRYILRRIYTGSTT